MKTVLLILHFFGFGAGFVAGFGNFLVQTVINKGPVADVVQVRERVRELLKLHVLSIVSNVSRPEYGLDKPTAELRVARKEAAPLVLLLGASSGRGLYARLGESLVVEVEPSLNDAVLELAGGKPEKPAVLAPEGEEGPEEAAHEEHEEHEGHAH